MLEGSEGLEGTLDPDVVVGRVRSNVNWKGIGRVASDVVVGRVGSDVGVGRGLEGLDSDVVDGRQFQGSGHCC